MSASSWEQGARFVRSASAMVLNTPVQLVTLIIFPSSVGKCVTCCDRKTVHSSSRRKSFQFLGSSVEGATRLRMPLPLFCLVVLFKLSGMYTSQTMSTL